MSEIASDKMPFFIAQNRGLLQATEADDFLHPEANAEVPDDSLSETQYLGFSVPEAGIHSYSYMWHRPNLGVITGGTFVFQGIKQWMVQSEICDMHTFMNDSSIKNDLHEYRYENSYGVKVIEPLKHLHQTYSDPARGNSIDLHHRALCPPIVFGDGKHFEQPMKVTGEISLRGKRYEVDCYNVRDRSWAKPRPETTMPSPPVSWMTGVFNDEYAFNCSVFDQVEGNPELPQGVALSHDRTLIAGWIWRDGEVGRIVEATKQVIRDPSDLRALAVNFQARDDLGRELDVRGTLVASCPWQTWHNTIIFIVLMRWECDGQVAYGDLQEAHWGDYHNAMAARRLT